MPQVVTFTKAGARSAVVEIEDDGVLRFSQRVDLSSGAGQKKLLLAMPGLTLPELLALVKQIPDDRTPFTHTHDPRPPETEFVLYVRGLHSPSETAHVVARPTPREALVEVLAADAYGETDPVMYWEGVERLACLDIDYHTLPFDDRPTPARLEALAADLHPRPIARHTSHGRGCKLYYAAEAGFQADELAACAGLAWRAADGRATFEIKRESRHPLYDRLDYADSTTATRRRCGPVHVQTSTLDIPAVAAWMGRSLDPDARDEWLAAKGLRIGEKRPHELCVIAPHVPSSSGDSKPPVVALDHGIHCFKCAGEHRVYGARRTAGFVPYSALVGGVDSAAFDMIRRLVHWPQARHVLAHTVGGAPDHVLRLAYRAALRMVHGDDPRIVNCFEAAPPLVRVGGKWLLSESTTLDRNVGKSIVAKLPAAMTVVVQPDGSKKVAVDQAKVDIIRHGNNPLGDYGFANMTPIRGCRIWGEFLPYQGGQIPFLTRFPDAADDRQPRYVPRKQRVDLAAAWAELEAYYPGLNREYVRLVIAAKGVAEGGSETPKILCDGVSAAGKSLHVEIAGGIVGDTPGEVPWVKDTQRLRQSIFKVADASDIFRVDEIVKGAESAKLTVRQALDFALNLTQRSESWQMYAGSQQLGRQMVMVATDIAFPPDIFTDLQIARRFARVRLVKQSADWLTTAAGAGLTEPRFMRDHSPELARACDAILSDIIDRYFTAPTTFPAIAADIGYPMIVNTDDFKQASDRLRQFFQAVCDAPDLSGADAKRYPGPGWKMVARDHMAGDEVSELWAGLADNLTDRWEASRLADSNDWAKVLGLPSVIQDVRLVRRRNGNKMAIRFVAGPDHRPTRVNEQLLTTGD